MQRTEALYRSTKEARMRRAYFGVTVTFTTAVVQQHTSPPPPSPE